jgi:hypothetical protein
MKSWKGIWKESSPNLENISWIAGTSTEIRSRYLPKTCLDHGQGARPIDHYIKHNVYPQQSREKTSECGLMQETIRLIFPKPTAICRNYVK